MASRTKADFKAIREGLGMSQALLADMVGVRLTSVKRWENPNYPWEPPEDAWDVLAKAVVTQDAVVKEAVERAILIHAEHGEPEGVDITYWRSEDDFEAAHPGQGPYWQMANANARIIARELRNQGYKVSFGWGGLRKSGIDTPENF